MKKLGRVLWAPIDRLATVPSGTPDAPRWSHFWRTLVLSGIVFLSIGAVASASWGLFSALWVGLPHAILAGTLGDQACINSTTMDCFRAIADARQSVLFSAGGLIALVGIVFTYLRWSNEAKTTRVSVKGGKLAARADKRERRQAQITEVTDALTLLDSTDRARQVAAISLLGDYAETTDDKTQARLILTVLSAFVRDRSENSNRVVEGNLSDEIQPIGPVTSLAVKTLSNAAAKLETEVDLSGLIFVDLHAPQTNWSYTDLRNAVFSGGNLTWARFGRSEDDLGQLIGTRFLGTVLSAANFSETELYSVEFAAGSARGGVGLALDQINFKKAELHNCVFDGLHLRAPRFTEAMLNNTSFRQTVLEAPRWKNLALIDCELHQAALPHGTDFTGVDLNSTTLSTQQQTTSRGLEGLRREGSLVTRVRTEAQRSEEMV